MKNKSKTIVRSVLIAVCAVATLSICCFAGDLFCACSMRATISNTKELTASSEFAVVDFYSFNDEQYSRLSKSMKKLSIQSDFDIDRVFFLKNGKAFFIARNSLDFEDPHIFLFSASVDDKEWKLIGEFESVKPVDYPIWYTKLDQEQGNADYSAIPAFYYDGTIVINEANSVAVYDISSNTISKYEKDQYHYPVNSVIISLEHNQLAVEANGKISHIDYEDLIESSREMKYLYELTLKQRKGQEVCPFFQYVTYYDTEPFIVCRPMSKYGLSFGALFKFDPETNTVTYIDTIFTNDFPDCVYPVKKTT